jgi:hypothetical protein
LVAGYFCDEEDKIYSIVLKINGSMVEISDINNILDGQYPKEVECSGYDELISEEWSEWLNTPRKSYVVTKSVLLLIMKLSLSSR